MSKKKKIVLIIVSVLSAAAIFFAGFFTSRLTLNGELSDFEYILDMYKKYYYYEQEDVVGIFAQSLLDKYSAYYTKEEYDAILNSDKGNREGVGVSFTQDLKLSSVLGNSPAQNAGVKEGGTIKGIIYGGVRTDCQTSADLSGAIEGVPANVDFEFLIEYDGVESSYIVQKRAYRQTFVKFTDSTGEYGFSDADGEMKVVKLSDKTLPQGVGYLVYEGFSADVGGLYGSAGQVEQMLKLYKEHNLTNVIIDLRNNGGGFMSVLEKVSAHFIQAKEGSTPLICVAKDKYGNEKGYYSAPVKYAEQTFDNIIVLANASTASASEAFIGALINYDTANKVKVIVEGLSSGGKTYYRTYGKGIMQTTYARLTGGAIKLTTAELFWPDGKVCIHNVGVTTALNDVYGQKVYNESQFGALYDALEFCS